MEALFQKTFQAKTEMPDLQQYPWNQIWSIGINRRFTEKCLFKWVSPLFLIITKCESHFHREIANKNNQFKETKTLISNLYLIRQSFKGTVVNRASPFLHGGSLEITITVPLNPCLIQLNLVWSNLTLFYTVEPSLIQFDIILYSWTLFNPV